MQEYYNSKQRNKYRNYAFQGCTGLTNITIPSSVTSIGTGAFYGCNSLKTSMTIPKNIITITKDTVNMYTNVETITIPNSVTSIESGAFSGCSRLVNIELENSNPNYSS